LVLNGGLVALTYVGFEKTPTGFVPSQDKQYLVAFAQLPEAASLERSEQVVRRVSELALKQPGVESVVAFPGLSINGFSNSPSAGILFLVLDPFEKRRSPDLSSEAIAGALRAKFGAIEEAFAAVFPPPPVQGLGTIGGFKMQIEDRAGLGFQELYSQTQNLVAKANATPGLAGVFTGFQINVPRVTADVDRDKAKAHGVALNDLFETMQIYLGSAYVNDFNRFGRTYQVNAQAEPRLRTEPEDILRLKTRNAAGEMIPLGAMVKVEESAGPDRVLHYNGHVSAELNGGPAPGFSSGQAQALIEELVERELPNGMTFEWTDLTYQQILAGNTALFVFPLCVLLVFVVLAGLYESLSLPLVVILIVPMCLLSALIGVHVAGGDNNIFTQIGLIVLVGLACKNAILIVEFAREREAEGVGTLQAVVEACRLRLRPILMTSLAFVMGVVPLITSSGAGAEMRRAMGVAVFSGMLGVTFFGLVLTPVFYLVVRRRRARAEARVEPSPLPAAS
jgi:hydrophobe/amphiphile efflux-1 (HAE1) family protein